MADYWFDWLLVDMVAVQNAFSCATHQHHAQTLCRRILGHPTARFVRDWRVLFSAKKADRQRQPIPRLNHDQYSQNRANYRRRASHWRRLRATVAC